MELELEIGASPGSMSRIESGQVNPTKETIINLSKLLELSETEIASLFSIPLLTPQKILSITSTLLNKDSIDEVLFEAVNEISDKLNYTGCSIFLLEGAVLKAKYVSQNNLSTKAVRAFGKTFDSLVVSKQIAPDNLMLKTALEGKTYTSTSLVEFGIGVAPPTVLKLAQKIIGMKVGISIPLKYKDEKIGALHLVKKDETDYSHEIPILQALANQISLIIFLNRQLSSVET